MTVSNSSIAVAGEVNVQGLSDLMKVMDGLPAMIQQNAMRGALRAGCNVIANEARLRAPVDTGQLKASIRVSVHIDNGVVKAFVKAGSRYKVYKIGGKGRVTKGAYKTAREDGGADYHSAFYAHWVEFGTAKAGARPFMRPALDVRKQDAVEAVAEYLRQRLPKEIAKLKR